MIPADTDFETEVTLETSSQPLPDDPPFRILFLGDWSGKGGAPLSDVFSRKPVEIDRDNYDDVMRKLNVQLELGLGDAAEGRVRLRFEELDDFHPDRIFEQVSMFSDLREIRRELQTESGFSSAAQKVRDWFEPAEVDSEIKEDGSDTSPEDRVAPSENLLEDILGDSIFDSTRSQKPSGAGGELGRLINKLVAPHVIQTDDSERDRLTKAVDEASSELMRAIIHQPDFQRLEAAWRALYLLVRKVETGSDLKIYLCDFSKREFQEDLKNASPLDRSEIYRIAVREAVEIPGAEPWALICGNYDFSMDVDDAAALIRISQIAQKANAPFIAQLSPSLFGLRSFDEANSFTDWRIDDSSERGKLWATVRALPDSSYLGLALPRFLTRLPYGEETDPTERFNFEEFKVVTEHENYVWGNPVFICALLLAESFGRNGWDARRGFQVKVSGLPTHIYKKEGETVTKPCAEILMTDPLCNMLLENGLMPVISFKNSDLVQLGRFQSIASPGSALKGKWNS